VRAIVAQASALVSSAPACMRASDRTIEHRLKCVLENWNYVPVKFWMTMNSRGHQSLDRIHQIPWFEFCKTSPLGPSYVIYHYALWLRSLRRRYMLSPIHACHSLFSSYNFFHFFQLHACNDSDGPHKLQHQCFTNPQCTSCEEGRR
jgi:hypothetical protein